MNGVISAQIGIGNDESFGSDDCAIVNFYKSIHVFCNIFFKSVNGGEKVVTANFPSSDFLAKCGVNLGNCNIAENDAVFVVGDQRVDYVRTVLGRISFREGAGVEIIIIHQSLLRSEMISWERGVLRLDSRFLSSVMVNSVAPFFLSEARKGVAIMALVDFEIFFMAAALSKCPILDFVVIGILLLRAPYI